HTRFSRDWSSDVCSSDLPAREPSQVGAEPAPATAEAFVRQLLPSIGRDLHVAYDLIGPRGYTGTMDVFVRPGGFTVQQRHLSHRSEERRVGKEGRAGWSA